MAPCGPEGDVHPGTSETLVVTTPRDYGILSVWLLFCLTSALHFHLSLITAKQEV